MSGYDIHHKHHHTIRVKDEDMAKVLLTTGVRGTPVILDARPFINPEGSNDKSGLSEHVGFHPDIIAGVLDNPHFSNWLKEAKRKVYQAAEESEGEIALGIFCTSGRHRSVALSVILGGILRAEGFSTRTTHLSANRWRGCAGKGCDYCSRSDSKRDDAIQEAIRRWREIKLTE